MLIKQRLEEAFEKKKNDVSNYIWKGPKVKNSEGRYVQETKKLVDCTIDELKKYYNIAMKCCIILIVETQVERFY